MAIASDIDSLQQQVAPAAEKPATLKRRRDDLLANNAADPLIHEAEAEIGMADRNLARLRVRIGQLEQRQHQAPVTVGPLDQE
jgi:hypothetical protein